MLPRPAAGISLEPIRRFAFDAAVLNEKSCEKRTRAHRKADCYYVEQAVHLASRWSSRKSPQPRLRLAGGARRLRGEGRVRKDTTPRRPHLPRARLRVL